ncbi:MAG: GGDEF domain-containing protein [Myxococcales bacterium]
MSHSDLQSVTRADLERMPLLSGANLAHIESMLRNCPVRRLGRGETLVEAGSENRHLFLILSGKLRVHLDSPSTPALVELGPGEAAGEISVIDRQPASAHLIAAEPTRVLVVDEELLWILADASHAVAYNLLRTLASRLRSGNTIILREREQAEHYRFHASIDALTGLFNRFWMERMLVRQMERARVGREPLSLLMIDVDHFKAFNDHHGHVAGDGALRCVASAMRDTVRPTDLVARYGGEEFVVLLPGAQLEQAGEVAERVRRAVRTASVVHFDGRPLPNVTISLGVAQMPEGSTPAGFIDFADAALYRAKEAGRDRVALAA